MTDPASRRALLGGFAAGALMLARPGASRAQPASVKLGLLHPVTGAFAYEGGQGRRGAQLAIEEINAAGGIRSLGGARIEPVLADAQSSPDAAVAEVDRLDSAGVCAIQGGFASNIGLAATQQAARHDLLFLCDVCVADQIVQRGLTNTFRFGPGFGKVVQTGLTNLVAINDAAGKPAKTVVIVHEDGAFGGGMAKLLAAQLPGLGFTVLDSLSHPTPQRDFTTIALRVRKAAPDLIIPSNYKNEFILMARAFAQQHVRPKVATYAILGGAASNPSFAQQYPAPAQYIMDCNNWYDPLKPLSQAFRKTVAARGWDLTYELMLNYAGARVLAHAIEAAGSTDRAKVIAAMAASSYSDTIMPYGPTHFVNGQNAGAQPINTQIQNGQITVVYPAQYASAKVVYPRPAG